MRTTITIISLSVVLAACGSVKPEDDGSSVTEFADAQVDETPAPTSEQTGTVGRSTEIVESSGKAAGVRRNASSLTGAVSDLNVRMTDLSLIVELPSDVLFEFDQATLSPAAKTQLTQAADSIRAGGEGTIKVVGHTDSKGSEEYNDALSLRRAEAVRDWFAERVGIRQREFEVEGLGEKDPIASNTNADGSDDPDARARNRRVDVIIPK